MKRKGFKSFVLKVCETKGVADAFLGKCVNLKSLGGILASFEVSRSFFRPLRGLSFEGPRLTSFTATGGDIPSRRLAITTEVRIPQMTRGCQGLISGAHAVIDWPQTHRAGRFGIGPLRVAGNGC